MKHISFESSQRNESNGIKIIKIQSLDAEIDQGTFKFSMKSNSVRINATDMKYIPSESSRWDESNGIKIIKIQSLDAEIDQGTFKFSMKSNSVRIDATDMKHIPSESSRWDESNGIKIIKIQLLDAEIDQTKNNLLIDYSKKFWFHCDLYMYYLGSYWIWSDSVLIRLNLI